MRRIGGVASRSSRPTDFSGLGARHQQLGGALSELSRQRASDEGEASLRSVRSAACSDELPFVQRDQGTRTGPLRDRNPRRNTVSGRPRLLPKRDPGVQTEANRVVGRIGDVLRYTDEFRRYGVSGPKTATEKAIETKARVRYRTIPAVDLRTITVRRWGYSRATTFDSMSRGKYVSVSVPSSVTSTVSEWR